VVDQKAIDQFDEQGFFVLNDIFNADELARLTKITDAAQAIAEAELKARSDNKPTISELGAITFAAELARQYSVIHEFVRHPKIVGLCGDLIGPDVRMYHDQAVYKLSEKPRRFPWHQDNGYLYVEPQHYLTCWIALTDATIENGCPQVATGLHRNGTLSHYFVDGLGFECFEKPPSEPAIAEVKAGGAVFFSSLTPHLTGPNSTSLVRKSYIVQYASSIARVMEGDSKRGPSISSHAIADEPRGLPILVDGRVAS
jgi:ectoine hydroxylase-related dioxygenase (phytanoyl-CoA dioxygenase family)